MKIILFLIILLFFLSPLSSLAYDIIYNYDSIGNITSKTETLNNGIKKKYTYKYDEKDIYGNSVNSYAVTSIITETEEGSPEVENFSYDGNSNMAEDGYFIYKWKFTNTLSEVINKKTGKKIQYFYDHTKQRFQSINETTKTYYFNKYSTEITDQNDKIIEKIKYIYEPYSGELVGMIKNDKTYFIHTDHLGSIKKVTNDKGEVVELNEYLPYGEQITNEQYGDFRNSRKYIGQEYDTDTGLLYLNARWYNPRIGKFLSVDPVIRAFPDEKRMMELGVTMAEYTRNPKMQNYYSYANNNPVAYKDVTGNASVKALITNPVETAAQIAFWRAGSEYLKSSRPASSAMMNHSLGLDPKSISINESNQSRWGNIITQIQTSKEFGKYITKTINDYSHNGQIKNYGSFKFSEGDLFTSLKKTDVDIIGNQNKSGIWNINVQVGDKYNYEFNLKDYIKNPAWIALNNAAAISQQKGAISEYDVKINFNMNVQIK